MDIYGLIERLKKDPSFEYNCTNDYNFDMERLFQLNFAPAPVNGYKAIQSGGEYRVEHELLDQYHETCCDESYIKRFVNSLFNGSYLPIPQILSAVGWMFGGDQVKDIFENGKWYKGE